MVTTLNVEPGGYLPESARLNSSRAATPRLALPSRSTTTAPAGRSVAESADARPRLRVDSVERGRRGRGSALDAVEHLDHLARLEVGELDVARRRAGQLGLVGRLDAREADQVTLRVTRLLQPLGRDLPGAADHVLGECRATASSVLSCPGTGCPAADRSQAPPACTGPGSR